MDCIIIHNGNKYSLEDFKGLLLTDTFLYEQLVGDLKESLTAVALKMKTNPELGEVLNLFELHNLAISAGLDLKNDIDKLSIDFINKQMFRNSFENETKEFGEADRYNIMMEILSSSMAMSDLKQNIDFISLQKVFAESFDKLYNDILNKGLVEEAAFMLENRDSILGTYEVEDSIIEYTNALLDIVSQEELITLSGENIKEHGQASYEVDITKALSAKVKIMFSAIQDPKSPPGFAGLKDYITGKDALDALQQILAEADNNSLDAIRQVINAKIDLNDVDLSFYKDILAVLDKVEKTDPDIIEQILYNLYQSSVQMKFVMWRKGSTSDSISLEAYDANTKNPLFVKRNLWTESFKNNGLISLYETDYYRVNPEILDEVRRLYNNISNDYLKGIQEIKIQDLKDFLYYFGITLNERTLENFYKGEIQNDFELVKRIIGEQTSLIHVLMDNIEKVVKSDKKLALKNFNGVNLNKVDVLNPLTASNSQLNNLIEADNFIEFSPIGSMYIAGKTINLFQQPNPITNKTKDIKNALATWSNIKNNKELSEEEKESQKPEILKSFKENRITSNSFLLDLMEHNPSEASKYFDTFLTSLEALKETGTKSKDDLGMTNLSDRDALVTLFGMYGASEGDFIDNNINDKYDNQIKLRKGYMNFPTLSDSSQLPWLKTILIQLQKHNVDLVEDTLDEHVLSILKDQLLKSDLLRTAEYLKNSITDSNILGYDVGSQFITGLASLNTLLVNYRGRKVTLKQAFLEYTQDNSQQEVEDLVDSFTEKFQTEIDQEIQNNITFEVNKYISKDGKTGELVANGLVKKGVLSFEDNKSDEKTAFNKKPARLIVYDYVINSMLQQKEIQTIFAGDLAFYFKDKMGKNTKHGLPNPSFSDILNYYYPESTDEIVSIIRNIISDGKIKEASKEKIAEIREALKEDYPNLLFSDEIVDVNTEPEKIHEAVQPVVAMKVAGLFKDVQNNLSKRLKGQLSPGNQYANVKNLPDTYQIVMSDNEVASETIVDMVQRIYPELYKNKEFINSLETFKNLDEKNRLTLDEEKLHKSLYERISKEIPDIAAYLKTTSTDAQEYTSWRNNLDQLKYQGRINSVDYQTIKKKLEAQSKELAEYYENNNKDGVYISPGVISEENLLTQEEMAKAMMQPSKPLFSGLVDTPLGKEGNHKVKRYVYIKSSSFPIIPQLAVMFPKLDNMRRIMEQIENRDSYLDSEGNRQVSKTVRMTYESAVKVGAPKAMLSSKEMQLPRTEADINNFIDGALEGSSMILPKEHFYIQQDKPFKSDKNAKEGKQDRTVRATQFEKIILGDGINKMGYIFPAENFDKELLSELGIKTENNNVSGPDLKAIYDHLYKEEQRLLSEKLFRELGIDSYDDIKEGNPQTMKKLASTLNKRLNNKQDKKALELIYYVRRIEDGPIEVVTEDILNKEKLTPLKAMFKIPLMMTPNSRKFESVLNSIINKNSINRTLPGYSFPVASQEGFDYRGYDKSSLEDLKAKGLVLSPNFNPQIGLQSERDALTGKLKKAQVFIANKYKIKNVETGKYEYINLQDYVDNNNILDFKKMPEELLSMFSFRIPTSRHQSGAVIEVVGFLPHNVGDLMIVPKDHTVQIGEDYDIDVRYAYQYNYIKGENGLIKKLEYSDVQKPEITFKEAKKQLKEAKDALWNKYYEKHYGPLIDSPLNIEENIVLKQEANRKNEIFKTNILFAQNALDNYDETADNEIYSELFGIENISKESLQNYIDGLINSLIPKETLKAEREKLIAEYRGYKNELYEEFTNKTNGLDEAWAKYKNVSAQDGNMLKVHENNLVAMYKSVFTSPDLEVRNMITSVLSTDFSENSAKLIDNKLSKKEPYFNIYSPHTQRRVMKLGADGKMGIGVHSNAVTMTSILQQLPERIRFIRRFDGEIVPYNIKLGNLVFDGVLGKIVDNQGRRISEYLSESQNSSTDNQKLEIMGRRNENAETISVFSFMQMAGLEDDGSGMSYASLFISQPIILDYVDRVKKLKSSTVSSFGSPGQTAFKEIEEELFKKIDDKYWAKDKAGNPDVGNLRADIKEAIGLSMTSKKLYNDIVPLDQVSTANPLEQFYILRTFQTLLKPSEELRELQSFINIESGGMGISYFDTINMKRYLDKIDTYNIVGENSGENSSVFELLFGDLQKTSDENEIEKLRNNEDYIEMFTDNNQVTFVKPTNHYSHKIMRSLADGYNMWNSLFPYDKGAYNDIITDILQEAGLKADSKKGLELQYDIVYNMKDFSYTSSTSLFKGNFQEIRDKIFFDRKDIKQESLAGYINRLRQDPRTKSMFSRPFFREIVEELNESDHPSIIKYSSGDMSSLNNLQMYNYLETLSKSKKELPSKLDGSKMTEEILMKELLMYSLIADQGNGAIGFRQLLPLSLFERYKVDSVLRARNNINNMPAINLIYKGNVKYLSSLLGSDINSNGIIVNSRKLPLDTITKTLAQLNQLHKNKYNTDKNLFEVVNRQGDIVFNDYTGEVINEDFIRQYFQHNPDKVGMNFKYSTHKNSKLPFLLESNGTTFEELNRDGISHLTLNDPEAKKYITLENNIGKKLLYERYDVQKGSLNFYKRIPTLGVFGYNEYEAGKTINSSTVEKNQFSQAVKKSGVILSDLEITNEEGIIISDLNTVISELNFYYDDKYSHLYKMLESFLPQQDGQPNWNGIDFQIVENMKGKASFKPSYTENGITYKPIITLNRSALENTSSNNIQDAILEEVLHYFTRSTIQDYIENINIGKNGIEWTFKEDVKIPSSLRTLMVVYKQAFDKYVEEYGFSRVEEEFNKIDNSQTLELTEEEQEFYRLRNIHEFIAGIFIKDKAFAEKMANTPYMQSGKNMLQKFVDTLLALFKNVLPNNRKDTISYATANTLFNFLQDYSNLNKENNNLLKSVDLVSNFSKPKTTEKTDLEGIIYDSNLDDNTNAGKEHFSQINVILEDGKYGTVWARKIPDQGIINVEGEIAADEYSLYMARLSDGSPIFFEKNTGIILDAVNLEDVSTYTNEEVAELIKDQPNINKTKNDLSLQAPITSVKYKC